MPEITYSDSRDLPQDQVERLYRENEWSAVNRPAQLVNALNNSHSIVSAWDRSQLVGLGNAISDGYLVVYYPHLLVRPEYHRMGIGRSILERLKDRYQDYHQQMIVADRDAVEFYSSCGFRRAGQTEPMWIYSGNDHDQ